MIKKIVFILFIVLVVFAVIYFFLFNDSYKQSLQAKVYYSLGEYKKAFSLSNEAYLSDPYNRMALSIMTASKFSLEYVKFIEDAEKYLAQINSISSKKEITNGELAKIKLICEVVMGEYKRLKPIIISDGNLAKKASKEYKKFEKIYEELFK